MPSLSIVMPVYNGAEFLPGAVDSVISQSSGDWELIIVDDGSDDGITPALCDSFAGRDPRIKALHKPNGGQADARNFALDNIDTEFLTFLDSDDLLHPEFVKLMLDAASRSEADIVFGEVDFYSGDFNLCSAPDNCRFTSWNPKYVAENILYQTGFDNAVGGKVYKSELWKSLRFPTGLYYEDLHISYRSVLRSQKIAAIALPLYGYRQHGASFIHTWSEKRLDVLDVTDDMVRWVGENAPDLLPAAADRRMSAHFNILLQLYKNRIVRPEVEDRCWRVIKQQRMASLRNPRVRLKNRLGALVSMLGGRKLLRILAHFA